MPVPRKRSKQIDSTPSNEPEELTLADMAFTSRPAAQSHPGENLTMERLERAFDQIMESIERRSRENFERLMSDPPAVGISSAVTPLSMNILRTPYALATGVGFATRLAVWPSPPDSVWELPRHPMPDAPEPPTPPVSSTPFWPMLPPTGKRAMRLTGDVEGKEPASPQKE
jgi:hypothetical protein